MNIAALLLIGSTVVAADEPLVAVVYNAKAKAYNDNSPALKRALGKFEGTPVDLKNGIAQDAPASAKVVIAVRRMELIGDQQFNKFVLEQKFSGVTLSRVPIVGAWKNVAAVVDYDLLVDTGKKKPAPVKMSAVGFASGKTGNRLDIKLNNDVETLMGSAVDQVGWKWHSDLLQHFVVRSAPLPDKIWEAVGKRIKEDQDFSSRRSNSLDPNLPILAPSAIAAQNNMVLGEFVFENRLPYGVSFEVEYFHAQCTDSIAYLDEVKVDGKATETIDLEPGETHKRVVSHELATIGRRQNPNIFLLQVTKPPVYSLKPTNP